MRETENLWKSCEGSGVKFGAQDDSHRDRRRRSSEFRLFRALRFYAVFGTAISLRTLRRVELPFTKEKPPETLSKDSFDLPSRSRM